MAAVGVYSLAVGALIFGFGRSSPVSLLSLGHLCIFSSSISVWSKIAIIEFFANYIFPASLSIICSVLISAKILGRSSNKRRLSSREQSSITSAPRISNRELRVCFLIRQILCLGIWFYIWNSQYCERILISCSIYVSRYFSYTLIYGHAYFRDMALKEKNPTLIFWLKTYFIKQQFNFLMRTEAFSLNIAAFFFSNPSNQSI